MLLVKSIICNGRMMGENVSVITVDGPSGTGKGTVSRMLAKHLSWHFLDSGILYRVLVLYAAKKGIQWDKESELAEIAKSLPLKFVDDQVLLDNIDVSVELRTEFCGNGASQIAALQKVREALLDKQRDFAVLPGLVTDGRDMGTVVFPQAKFKFYLHASVAERARRRHLQLLKAGNNDNIERVCAQLAERDLRDASRSYSPLVPANDAVVIDTTSLSIQEVFNLILQVVIGDNN
jgi:CMP/dCMP kinase